MHLRRALLLFALVLGLTALATAVAPAPRTPSDSSPPPAPPPQAAVPAVTNVTLPAPAARPQLHRVQRDAHVVVQVEASEGGQVEIPKQGRIQSVGAGSTAQFDLLGLSPGRYDVLFEPALGSPGRIGTLVSR